VVVFRPTSARHMRLLTDLTRAPEGDLSHPAPPDGAYQLRR